MNTIRHASLEAVNGAAPGRLGRLARFTRHTTDFGGQLDSLADVVSFQVGQRLFTGKHLQVSFSHPGVLQAVVFGAVAVSLIAVIGVGLGGLIRHTAGATTALVLLIVGGVCYLVDLLAAFLLPDFGQSIHGFVTIPCAIAEISMVIYLLVVGVRTPAIQTL